MVDIKNQTEENAAIVEKELTNYLQKQNPSLKKLLDSMRYSTLGGGKRIRPYLTISFARVFGADIKSALPYACAIELIHTYSLIHDDLPCMDNDDLRRGKPTNHKVFGESIATLSGDALLTYAFEVAASNEFTSPENRLEAVKLLATSAGAFGMVGGQQIDLESENKNISFEKLLEMHSLKTGALIDCACMLGVIAADKHSDSRITDAVRVYSNAIGLTFQIIDDIIDKTVSSENSGKSSSDSENNKTTFLSFMSIADAYDYAAAVTAKACAAILPYDKDGLLCGTAKYLLMRTK